MNAKMKMIFTKEEIARITEKIQGDVHMLTVDVHGLKVKEAKRFLNNLIAVNSEAYDIRVIHGYNHGTAIKEMVRTELESTRLLEKKSVRHNPGQTILKMNKAA